MWSATLREAKASIGRSSFCTPKLLWSCNLAKQRKTEIEEASTFILPWFQVPQYDRQTEVKAWKNLFILTDQVFVSLPHINKRQRLYIWVFLQ